MPRKKDRAATKTPKQKSQQGMNAVTEQDQNWRTPPWLKAKIEHIAGSPIDLDPCCGSGENNLCVPYYYTEEDDGLSQPWSIESVRVVFVNPPYKQTMEWVKKIALEVDGDPELSIFLLSTAYSDQPWYHLALQWACSEYSVKGRVRFLKPDGRKAKSPRFPSTVFGFKGHVWNPNHEPELIEECLGEMVPLHPEASGGGHCLFRGRIEKGLDISSGPR